MKHAEVHLIKKTDPEIFLAELTGLLEFNEKLICMICSKDLFFVYVLLGEETKRAISCEKCIQVALARVMM